MFPTDYWFSLEQVQRAYDLISYLCFITAIGITGVLVKRTLND